jgi:hypothetical protein
MTAPGPGPARKSDPIDRIEWVDARELKANHYNPNIVFNQELRLLERSIMRTGWVQPILISRDGTIIDGFHRWRLALDSAAVRGRYDGRVPCARLRVGPAEAMLLTVRMNRAKGTHTAVRMSALVKELIDVHQMDPEQIATEIGGDRAEVDLLYQDSLFKAKNIKEYRYSRSWIPADDPATAARKAAHARDLKAKRDGGKS